MSLQSQYDNREPEYYKSNDDCCPDCGSEECLYKGGIYNCPECGFYYEPDYSDMLI